MIQSVIGSINRTAVVLLQLGGPDSPEAVEPFLYNLFCDPDIIDLPGAFLFRKGLARLISRTRAPKARELYAAIGGRSPILEQTAVQADALRTYLASRGVNLRVEIAMRYWHPLTGDTLRSLHADGIERVILLPLYPHFSKSTTGSSWNEWHRAARVNGAAPRATLIRDYFNHPDYIDSIALRMREALARIPEAERGKVHLLFSAHGTPMTLVRQGDPYSLQIRKTYEAVIERGNFGLPHRLCFQSKVGPQKWLRPSLLETLEDLARNGVTHIVANPIAFVSDHIETLSEIDIEARHYARELGITRFEMTAPLLDSEPFIRCLGELVISHMSETP
jgi:protoporphyrin/coproporphyrin ferrochelatase